MGSAAALKSWSLGSEPLLRPSGPARRILPLDQNWLFGGKSSSQALEPEFDDAALAPITLPHSVTQLSWRNWNPSNWEDTWVYRRHFSVPSKYRGLRLFLHFDRVMAGAVPVVNGRRLEPHLGGFLPFEREITGLTRDKDNLLAVEVDSRWLNVPPSGSPRGPASVDYLLPGGIAGSVELRAVPAVFLREVFAKPVDVLSNAHRRVEIACRVDAAAQLPARIRLTAALHQGERTIATVSQSTQVEQADQEINLTLDNLRDVQLWDGNHPHLYELAVTLSLDDQPLHRPVHRYDTRIGFREARFELDGFFLNGNRVQLFGLNRHELYPYLGFAAPRCLLRRDAEILRRKFNCNAVRCSHYPQSEAFLDACDELGLLVWEELPGWQYIGNEDWKNLAINDVEAMVRRDRNHPSIIVWGVRINESQNDPELYRRTRALARSLDDSRATSGTMTSHSTEDWGQDVFAYDDYHAAPDHTVGIAAPLPGVPYMVAECVGQFNYRSGKNFDRKYRRAGDPVEQSDQALFHAQAHSKAAENPRCAGAIAWCAFDYASLMNSYDGVKCPGIADVFRLPKLGASFYLAQIDPAVRPVIEPDFYWDLGPRTPQGPGERAAIFSNCERLELLIDGKPHATLHPDRAGFPHLLYPPFFADLKLDDAAHPELRIDGFIGGTRVLSRSFSSDSSSDRLSLYTDDDELECDGSDATRLAFAVVDKFGAPRAFAAGEVSLDINGPGVIVGDNPFPLTDSGGSGAVWVKTLSGRSGQIRIEARHKTLGSSSVNIQVRPAKPIDP
jgi:beta-galactosidase